MMFRKLLPPLVLGLCRRQSQPFRWLSILLGGLIAVGVLSISFSSSSQPAQGTLRVATRLIPPFVIQENHTLSGFSIDLWNSIATQLNLESKIQIYPSVTDLLAAVKTKQADVGIAAISMTSEREKSFDFSLPMFSSGLQVMVRDPKQGGAVPHLLHAIFSKTLLQLLGVALLMIGVIAHLVWLVEGGRADSSIDKRYFPGIFEAIWWASATLATQAEQMPRGPLARVLAVFWMFTGVVFVAFFTATFTSVLTVQQLQGDITGIDDLSGRLVATTSGSTAAEYLHDHNIRTLEFSALDQVYQALLERRADAVVFDAPVLMYYATHAGKGQVETVGEVFRKEQYGIVMPNGSAYRKPINTALLELQENGTYQTLYDRYFTPSH